MNNELTFYKDACKYFDDLQMHKIKLGLEAMRSILSKLGSPENKYPVVHVAGTNGKGSVCSMLRSILSEAGYKTGLYTSPHLSSIRERFRIDDRYIEEDDFTRLMERIRVTLDGKTITYFECATALAFSWFAEQNCDLVILETGMGGRLDATNVVTPLVSVITTISLDHEQYLGDSVEAVAYEKAGIIKQGVPVVSGVLESGPRAVIEQACTERGVSLVTRDTDFLMEPDGDALWTWREKEGSTIITGLPSKKRGRWQIENSSCVIATLMSLRNSGYTISDGAIRQGLGKAHWPGRLEYLEIPSRDKTQVLRLLLDGAHNPAGVAHLIDVVNNQFVYERLFLVWASMGDKNYETMLRAMALEANYLLLTRPDSERSASPEDLARALEGSCNNEMKCFDTVEAALTEVMDQAQPDDLVVVAGSLYLIGEFRKLLLGEVVE